MAHDRQVERSSSTSEDSRQLKTSLDVVADWLTVYGKVYREEISEELVLVYCETLRNVEPEVLHEAFLRALRKNTFRPTPAAVLDAVDVILADRNPGTRIEYPAVSQEEREAAWEETKEQRDALRAKLGLSA